MIHSLHPMVSEGSETWYDAELIEFVGWEDVSFENPEVDDHARGAPEIIELIANLATVSQLDLIATAPSLYLLVSHRMVGTLQSVALFPHELFPCTIYSHEISHLVMDEATRYRTSHQVLDPGLRNDNFVILKLREMLDCLDEERTIVRGGVPLVQSERKYLGPYDGEHFEFYPPQDGFPPVFCVPQLVFYCYTEAAKQACERAGLKGLRFEPLP